MGKKLSCEVYSLTQEFTGTYSFQALLRARMDRPADAVSVLMKHSHLRGWTQANWPLRFRMNGDK